MISATGYAQLSGVVYGEGPAGNKTLLPAANVYWVL